MKKILLMTLALVVFIISCGQKKASNDEVIKIGVIAPLTGEVAQYGVAVRDGVQLRVDQINEAGGINGKKIELVIADSKGDSQEARNIFKKMVSQDKVSLVIGEVISSASLAISDLAQTAKVPMISASSTNLDVTKGKDYVFRTTFTDPFQGEIIAKYVAEKGYKKIAVLTNTSSDYSVGLADTFKAEASKAGLTIIEEKYTKDDKDFKSLLTKIKGENPEVIFIPDYYNTIGLMVTQANELGIKAQYLGGDGWDGIQENFASQVEGAIFASQFAPNDTDAVVQKFISDYTKKYSKEPTIFQALGYDTAMVVENALKNTKDLTGEAIKESLFATEGLELVTGSFKFDSERNPKKKVTFIEVKGGKLTLKEKK